VNNLLYAFSMEEETSGELWNEVIRLVHPDDLLYAVWAGIINNDDYFLGTIFENIPEEDDDGNANGLMCDWVDLFYTFWEDRMYKIKNSNSEYELATCKFLNHTSDLFVELRRKDNVI
jgi:hypothetical protein